MKNKAVTATTKANVPRKSGGGTIIVKANQGENPVSGTPKLTLDTSS